MRTSSVGLIAKVKQKYKLPDLIVDIGGYGYKNMWESLGIKAKVIDLKKGADIVADITHMPHVKSRSIGTIICLDTLEHVSQPWLAILEFWRVLKKDGLLIIDVPFIWDYHKHDEDYWRFSVAGLEQLCKKFTKLESGWMQENSPLGLENRLYEEGGKYVTISLSRSCSYFIGRK